MSAPASTKVKRTPEGVNAQDVDLHARLQKVLDEHQRTPTTCTCGHWVYDGWGSHLQNALREEFEGYPGLGVRV